MRSFSVGMTTTTHHPHIKRAHPLFERFDWSQVTSVFVEKALKLAQPDLDAIVMERLGYLGLGWVLWMSHGQGSLFRGISHSMPPYCQQGSCLKSVNSQWLITQHYPNMNHATSASHQRTKIQRSSSNAEAAEPGEVDVQKPGGFLLVHPGFGGGGWWGGDQPRSLQTEGGWSQVPLLLVAWRKKGHERDAPTEFNWRQPGPMVVMTRWYGVSCFMDRKRC